MATGISSKYLTRGELILRLYKVLTMNGTKIEVNMKEEINYKELIENLNKHLRESQEIKEEELITLHRGTDSLLSFLFLISIGLKRLINRY